MGKIYGLHSLELRPGVTGEEFERFLAGSLEQLPTLPGWRIALLKGERGDQVGQYLALVEVDSIEARNRVSPGGGFDDTAEGREWLAVAGPDSRGMARIRRPYPGAGCALYRLPRGHRLGHSEGTSRVCGLPVRREKSAFTRSSLGRR